MNHTNRFRSWLKNLVWFIPIGTLALSFLHLPIGYYGFMRFIITASAVYLAYFEYKKTAKISVFLVLFVIVAVLFNPVIRVHFYRYQWQFINISILLLFAIHYFKRKSDLHGN